MEFFVAVLTSLGIARPIADAICALMLPALGAGLLKLFEYVSTRNHRELEDAQMKVAAAQELELAIVGMRAQIEVLVSQNERQEESLKKAEARAEAAELRAEEACKQAAIQEQRLMVLSTKIDVLIQATTFCPIDAANCPARRAIGLVPPKVTEAVSAGS